MTTTDVRPVVHPTPFATHEVTNQAPRLVNYDASGERALLEALTREGGGENTAEIRELGVLAGSATVQDWADQANRHLPELRTFDRLGNRIDEVDYHPAYHHLMREGTAHRLGASAWAEDHPGAHVAYWARHLVWGQTDQGHMCPMSMSYAAVPALREAPHLSAIFEPLLTSTSYDPTLSAPTRKAGLTAGMSMTEKQGGSDLRTNTTVAEPTAEDGTYRLTGHKWFTSAPMCDLFLVLAQAPGGPTCFLVPRVLPDGTRNSIRLQRLKDKLGNKANASCEPEFDGTVAWRVGDEGRGIPVILKMVMSTRLSVISLATSQMRAGFLHAHHHAGRRRAFGKLLIDQPLMRNVLADLALESEAATSFTMRLAGAFDRSARGDTQEGAFARIATAVGKYWIAKKAAPFAAEALECLGGNGYTEESIMPRLYREAPLHTIWEGSSNVNALDVLRAMNKEPDTREAVFAELALARGADTRLDRAVDAFATQLERTDDVQLRARRTVEDMALLLQASLLVRHAPSATADAFVSTRLDRQGGQAYGTLPTGTDLGSILDRAEPLTRT